MFYLGVLGRIGSGKDEFCKILREVAVGKSVTFFPASVILGESLDIWALERRRENYERFTLMMLKEWGQDAFSNALRHRIRAQTGDIIVVTGLRLPNVIPMIRTFKPSLIVYVHTHFDLRFIRRRRSQEKAGEGVMTKDEFRVLDNGPLEANILAMRKEADFAIENNSDREALRAYAVRIYDNYITPALQ